MRVYGSSASILAVIIVLLIYILFIALFVTIWWVLMKNAIKRGVEHGICNAFNDLKKQGDIENLVAQICYYKNKYSAISPQTMQNANQPNATQQQANTIPTTNTQNPS